MSVLLPVHRGVAPDHLRGTLASIAGQTLRAKELVLVEDGPLDMEHYRVIDAVAAEDPSLRRIVLPHNQGAGVANQVGLEEATGVWIAKADADDINLPHRFRVQYEALHSSGVDVCGAAMLEFVGAPENVLSVRRGPKTHEAIQRRMRINNPINHPTVVYRRALALDAGGYPDWRFVQDYGLFARMAARGARMMNLDEPLVLFRGGEEMNSRRRSAEVRRGEVLLQRHLYDQGIISRPRMGFNIAWRSAFRLMPSGFVALANRRVLSRPVVAGDY